MWYDQATRELVVAMNKENRLERIPATTTGVRVFKRDPDPSVSAYPNPFRDLIHVSIPDGYPPGTILKLVSPEGKIILSPTLMFPATTTSETDIDLNGCGLLAAGLYHLVFSGDLLTVTIPLIYVR